jgi:hypothetical protein
MDAVWKWMVDNQVFSGLAVAVLTMLGGVVAYFYQRRKQPQGIASHTVQTGHVGTGNVVNVQGTVGSLAVGAAAGNPSTENVRVDVKQVTPQGGIPPTSNSFEKSLYRDIKYLHHGKLLVYCHNLTATPVVIYEIRVLEAESRTKVAGWDGGAKRMEGFGFIELNLYLPTEHPEPPSKCLLNITTVRGGSFDSAPFNWGEQ